MHKSKNKKDNAPLRTIRSAAASFIRDNLG